MESDLVDLFSTAGVGVKYATNSTLTRSVGQYQAAINNTYDEIDFSSREEARDFNKLVNTIFFVAKTESTKKENPPSFYVSFTEGSDGIFTRGCIVKLRIGTMKWA